MTAEATTKISPQCLNGVVVEGATVAIGVRDGNSGGIRLGVVEEVRHQRHWDGKPAFRWNRETQDYTDPVCQVKVRVTATSGYGETGKTWWYGTENMVIVAYPRPTVPGAILDLEAVSTLEALRTRPSGDDDYAYC